MKYIDLGSLCWKQGIGKRYFEHHLLLRIVIQDAGSLFIVVGVLLWRSLNKCQGVFLLSFADTTKAQEQAAFFFYYLLPHIHI